MGGAQHTWGAHSIHGGSTACMGEQRMHGRRTACMGSTAWGRSACIGENHVHGWAHARGGPEVNYSSLAGDLAAKDAELLEVHAEKEALKVC